LKKLLTDILNQEKIVIHDNGNWMIIHVLGGKANFRMSKEITSSCVEGWVDILMYGRYEWKGIRPSFKIIYKLHKLLKNQIEKKWVFCNLRMRGEMKLAKAKGWFTDTIIYNVTLSIMI